MAIHFIVNSDQKTYLFPYPILSGITTPVGSVSLVRHIGFVSWREQTVCVFCFIYLRHQMIIMPAPPYSVSIYFGILLLLPAASFGPCFLVIVPVAVNHFRWVLVSTLLWYTNNVWSFSLWVLLLPLLNLLPRIVVMDEVVAPASF